MQPSWLPTRAIQVSENLIAHPGSSSTDSLTIADNCNEGSGWGVFNMNTVIPPLGTGVHEVGGNEVPTTYFIPPPLSSGDASMKRYVLFNDESTTLQHTHSLNF